MYDVIIVGAGPAGISAGLYAKRANKDVLILYYGESNLEKAHLIDNYYGFENSISGKQLFENGVNQAKNLGIDIRKEEVLYIDKLDYFKVKTENEEFEGKTLILATGNKKMKPNIEGIDDFDGKGISYCAICDGFFYRGKNVVVIGNSKFAISEANDLKNIANNVKILTDGKIMEASTEFEIINTKIKKIKGDSKVKLIEFDDGTTLDVDGVFIALGQAGATDFAKKIGALMKDDIIIVDENMETNVKGLYSCGNATGGLLQVCKAVYQGAIAGLSVINYLNS